MAACLLPGGWIAVRSGFFVEQDCLKRLDRSLHDRRVKDLVKGEMSDLLTRGATIALFAVVVWLSLLLTLDRVLSLLFSVELLTGRMFSGSGFLPDPEAMFDLVASDLRLLTVIAAIGLLVYAVGRLAWFFCYVDLRVRRDCWDMELRFTQEARRLQAAGSPHPERVSP